MALDIVLLPNCDLHVTLGTPSLKLQVFSRDLSADKRSYTLTPITASCSFDLFAPYNAVGNRLQAFVSIDPATGEVKPSAVGINLMQIRWVDNAVNPPEHHYIIARIQVHDTILGWWFGNSSITTAKDRDFAHAQPSIYALFSDDAAAGTDLVGDITGHGYVPLTSGGAAVFTVNADGRLQGHAEGSETLSGTFLRVTHTIPVKVVDYAKSRPKLDYVQIPNIDHPEEMHNFLFLSEGFRDTADDREKFNRIVTEVVEEMFSKPRHSPYGLLEGSFNVWKVFESSEQHGVTCGYRVNDEKVPGQGVNGGEVPDILPFGHRIPYRHSVSPNEKTYSVEQLVQIVGLPRRNETQGTAQLKTLWQSQSLMRFDPTRVDDNLVSAWKSQKSLGILEARDTFFGLYLGSRYGDRSSGFSLTTAVLPPASDNPTDAALAPFIKQLYEWFDLWPARTLTPDPRRHPPQLQVSGYENIGNSILRYVSGLKGAFPPNPNVGQEWIPDPNGATLKKSRGFIAIITNDDLIGGTNFNASTMTANTLGFAEAVTFQYTNVGNERVMRRTPPSSFRAAIEHTIDTVAHEFGHSFNLADEYEEIPRDDPGQPRGDLSSDNVTRLAVINFDAEFLVNRKLDPDKVKWFDLLRVDLSDTLIKDSETVGGQIRATIRTGNIGRWIEARSQNLEAFLRRPDIAPDGRQLPLKFDASHYLVRLVIEEINETNGTILLGGLELPAPPLPVFPKGSLLFIPKRDASSQLVYVVEKKVLDKLESTNLPLNQDTDTTKVNSEADHPVGIPDFKPPCKSYKLIGVYEGASRYSGMTYRPSGLCKMRKSGKAGIGDGEFCHVCKYLIVQRVDPGLLDLLDKNHYPGAKKGG